MASRAQILGVAQTLICLPDQLTTWLRAAHCGDRALYATGPELPQADPTVALTGMLQRQGLVRVHHARNPNTRAFDFFVVRTDRALAAGAKPASAAVLPSERVFEALRLAAEAARPCPTDAELAGTCGLRNADAARYMRRKLAAAGRIDWVRRGPNVPIIVTISGTDLRTAEVAHV